MKELREILEHLFNSGGAYATGDLLGGKPIEQAEQAIRAWAVNKLPMRKEGIVAFLDKEGKQYYSKDQLAYGAWNQHHDLAKKALEVKND